MYSGGFSGKIIRHKWRGNEHVYQHKLDLVCRPVIQWDDSQKFIRVTVPHSLYREWDLTRDYRAFDLLVKGFLSLDLSREELTGVNDLSDAINKVVEDVEAYLASTPKPRF